MWCYRQGHDDFDAVAGASRDTFLLRYFSPVRDEHMEFVDRVTSYVLRYLKERHGGGEIAAIKVEYAGTCHSQIKLKRNPGLCPSRFEPSIVRYLVNPSLWFEFDAREGVLRQVGEGESTHVTALYDLRFDPRTVLDPTDRATFEDHTAIKIMPNGYAETTYDSKASAILANF